MRTSSCLPEVMLQVVAQRKKPGDEPGFFVMAVILKSF